MRGAEIEPLVQPRIAEQRVPPHPESRCQPPGYRLHHGAALLADARCLEPLGAPAARPFDHADLALALIQPCIEQLADLGLAGFGARMFDDDVEPVVGPQLAHRHLGRDRADIGLDRAARNARRARRGDQIGSAPPLDAQRGVVDRDRNLAQAQRTVHAFHLQPHVEGRAEREHVERARNIAVGAAAERDVHPRAGDDLLHRHGLRHHPGHLCGLGIAHARAGQYARKAVAAADGCDQIDRRAFGGRGQRRNQIGRVHPLAHVAAQRHRLDHLRARFAAFVFGDRVGLHRDQRAQSGRQRPGGGDEDDAGG